MQSVEAFELVLEVEDPALGVLVLRLQKPGLLGLLGQSFLMLGFEEFLIFQVLVDALLVVHDLLAELVDFLRV